MNNCSNCDRDRGNTNNNANNSNVRSSYHQKALQQIRSSLQPFATVFTSNSANIAASCSSTSSSPLPTPQPPPPPYYAFVSSHHTQSQDRSPQIPGSQQSNGNILYMRCDSQPPSPPPPIPPSREPLHYYNNGYFTPSNAQLTSSDEYFNPVRTLTPNRGSPCNVNEQQREVARGGGGGVGSQLPPPPVSRSGGIEYRAQQYPFVPSQVPMNVQQLLGRITLPVRNESPPNFTNIRTTPSPQQPHSSSSSSTTTTTSSKTHKPTLIIKSTVVPKPVLQTATSLEKQQQQQQQQSQHARPPVPPPPPYEKPITPPPPLPPKPGKKPDHHETTLHYNTTTQQPQFQSQQQQQPPPPPSSIVSQKPQSSNPNVGATGASNSNPPEIIHTHESPIPERKKLSKEKEEERYESKVRVYSPAAFKFFMEQHVENVIKSHQERLHRRLQLESEMAKIGLSEEAQTQMRKMLSQKESNYIRLKRAKMDKSMFKVIRTIGVGAFGEVALVRKIDTQLLYAMKTLRKSDVLRRNQVAHVKAERDILAEADNEWVVKLYYSFQDKDHLYFVMDYIPGGDLMSLLIKEGIFEESLAQFYIAELTCAIESVHKMGFIHRDIKPDNILIDRDGHIKLTDFGLCTGFRWTHNSRYYQDTTKSCVYCTENICNEHSKPEQRERGPKVLERRRMMKKDARCLAHSLVGTPNYIAPEVLLRTGYTQLCDWWSVGVILYEMVVGQPPFHADSPADTQFKVIHWEKTLRFPSNVVVSAAARDLILKLCTDHSKRLGKNGAQEIKNHAFLYPIFHPNASVLPPPPDYSDISSISSSLSSATNSSTYSSTSWNSTSSSEPINIRRTIAPYIPKIAHPTDTSNFDPCEEESEQRNEWNDEYSDDNQFHGFFEFTFRRFFDDAYHLDFMGHEKDKDKKNQESKNTPNRTPQQPPGNGPVYV